MTTESRTNSCAQPDTKSNPNPNPNPTTKQHAVVNIQPNIVECPAYPEKFVRDDVVGTFVPDFGCHCNTPLDVAKLLNSLVDIVPIMSI